MRLAMSALCAAAMLMAVSTLQAVPALAGEAPPLPPNALPMYVADPVLPDNPANKPGFACFKACGASCDCVGRVDGSTTTKFDGQTCEWHTVECKTHSFCAWHDTCYSRCDYQFPGHVSDGSVSRSLCYRACDASCATGADPRPVGTAWQPATLDPGPPPAALGVAECLKRLANDPSVSYDGTLVYAELIGCH